MTISVAVAVIVPVAFYTLQIGFPAGQLEQANSNFGFFDGNKSTVENPRSRAEAVPIFQTSVVPAVQGYHHITYASVEKLNQSSLLFTVGLAGDPNRNTKYETSYHWRLLSSSSHLAEQDYTIIIPNFANDSDFPKKGWYYAIFNNTSGSYVVPMRMIGPMPSDKVVLPVSIAYLGDPLRFYYSVTVEVRVNATNFDRGPDYMMDVAP